MHWKEHILSGKTLPTLLTVLSAAGVGITAVMAVKNTPKALAVLQDAETEKGSALRFREKVIIAAPVYIPAILVGTATISCIFGGHILNQRQQTALISAFALLDASYREYREHVAALYGRDTDLEIRGRIAEEHQKTAEMQNGNERVLFFDEYSNRYFWRSMLEVVDAEYHFNRNLALRGYAELNEFYEFLGLKPTEYGLEVGWNLCMGPEIYGYEWVDFDHVFHENHDDPDSPSYYQIVMPFAPHRDFME